MSYLKSTSSNLWNCKISYKKISFKLGTKNVLFEYFWARIWTKCCHIWAPPYQHLRICQNVKFNGNKKNNFGAKTTLFGCFRIEFAKSYFHTWNQHPWILQDAKFQTKKKIKFDTKIALFGYFWATLLKIYCQMWHYARIGTICTI